MSGSLSVDEPLVVLAGLEPRLAEAVRSALREDGIATLDTDRARTAATVRARRVTAVVLDASTQIAEALGVCRTLRDDPAAVPVVALARDDVDARIALLEDGADDCLSKPFAPRELVARLHALRRRAATPAERRRTLEHADLRVDLAGRRAWRGGRELGLTCTEFALLTVLVEDAERVVPRKDLLVAVWGFDYGPEFHSLGVYVGYLRRKLERDGEPRLLHTVRGVGYVLRAEAA